MKNMSFCLLFFWVKPQQAISGTSAATYKIKKPYSSCFIYCFSSRFKPIPGLYENCLGFNCHLFRVPMYWCSEMKIAFNLESLIGWFVMLNFKRCYLLVPQGLSWPDSKARQSLGQKKKNLQGRVPWFMTIAASLSQDRIFQRLTRVLFLYPARAELFIFYRNFPLPGF